MKTIEITHLAKSLHAHAQLLVEAVVGRPDAQHLAHPGHVFAGQQREQHVQEALVVVVHREAPAAAVRALRTVAQVQPALEQSVMHNFFHLKIRKVPLTHTH